MNLSKISRVELINESGRVYTNYDVKEVKLDLQDTNRTLKIFVK